MSKIKIILIILFSGILLFNYSCQPVAPVDPPEPPDTNDVVKVNAFNIKGTTYSEFHTLIQTNGKSDYWEGYSHWLAFASNQMTVTVDDNDAATIDGTGHELIIAVYTNVWGEISAGTYNFDTTNVTGTFGSLCFWSGDPFVFYAIESGTMIVLRNGTEYEIDITLVDELGDTISVYYKGDIDFHYDREHYFFDDRDQKYYDLVKIGDQIWFQDNFAHETATGCSALNDDPSTVEEHGYMYTADVADSICPDGFRIPTSADITTLLDYYDDDADAYTNLMSDAGYQFNATTTGFINTIGTHYSYITHYLGEDQGLGSCTLYLHHNSNIAGKGLGYSRDNKMVVRYIKE